MRDKIFTTFGANDDGIAVATMKAPEGEQQILLAASDDFFYPAYVGTRGWVGIRLHAKTDWTEIAELVEESYRMVAPKKLARQLDEEATSE